MSSFKKVYITKYALTHGAIDMKVVELDKEEPDVCIDRSSYTSAYYHKPEWHLTLEEASAKAENMRLNKIASLTRQIAKLKQMKFR